MSTAKHVPSTLAVGLLALLANAQAQTARVTTVNVHSDGDRVRISAQGDVTEMRIEVVSEAGDIVYETGAIAGQELDWEMADPRGERVEAGTYLVTITFRNAAGKLRKRVEQVTVNDEQQVSTEEPAATVKAAITGKGTNGKLAKFIGGTTIANSIIGESAGKVTLAGTAANSPTLSSSNTAANGVGLQGSSSNATGIGVRGTHTATTGITPGVLGETDSTDNGASGVLGQVNNPQFGKFSYGVYGVNKGTHGDSVGVRGDGGGVGVFGFSSTGDGVGGYSKSGLGVFGLSETGYACWFEGKSKFNGTLEVGGNVGIGTATPKAKVHVVGGNVFIAKPHSLIITSPNSSCWQIRVNDAGALFAASIPCPS